MSELVVERDGAVAVRPPNRPERLNAISPARLQALSGARLACDRDPAVREKRGPEFRGE